MLQELHAAGNTVVLITHDNSIAVQAQRIIRLEDGHVIYDGDATRPQRPWFAPACRREREDGRYEPAGNLSDGHQKHPQQQDADLPHHAGHHHRRVRRSL